MRINYSKHFEEDDKFKEDYELPYKTLRYVRKLKLRNTCAAMKPQTFLGDEEYKDMQIWDLKYISTSDEEDNDSDSSEGSESSEEDGEEKKVDDTKKPDDKDTRDMLDDDG